MKLNPSIKNPNLILVNQKIKIPEMTESLLIVQSREQYKIHLRTFSNLKSADQYQKSEPVKGKEIDIVPWKVSPEETWYRVTGRAIRQQGRSSGDHQREESAVYF